MKILQIGAGGIGSYLARAMNELYIQSVNGTEGLNITIIDGDEVEEKNLQYQNFEIEDLEESKSKVIGKRYNLQYKHKFIESDKDLDGFDLIVLAVDNGKVRDLVYKFCDKTKKKFIDLRSEGRGFSFFVTHKMNNLKKMLSTIDVEKPSTSCQLKFELDQGLIQQGNKIVAYIGSQLILNELRGDKNPPEFIQLI